ncbi:MAG: type II and III secretion system protein family protein [bacterium]
MFTIPSKVMKKVTQIALTLLVMISLGGTAALANDQVRINSGGTDQTSRSLLLPLSKAAIVELPDAAADILVADPEVVDAIIRTPKRVYILGLKVGQTNAFFFDSRGRQILNLEITVDRDLAALDALLTKILPETRITTDTLNENVILKGSAANAAEAQKAVDIARRFVGDDELVMNMITVRERSQVMLKVRIVEMQRRLVKQIGINGSAFAPIDNSSLNFGWQNNFGISSTAVGGISGRLQVPTLGDLSNLDFAFDAFEGNGLVKVLAEPTLTAVSGEGATFLAGGEFPIPVNSETGVVTIEFKKFGVSLGFRPVVYSKDRINLQINTEVSEISQASGFALDSQTVVDPDTGEATTFAGLVIPGLNVRRVETVAEVHSGGSLAIAGLLQENIQEALEGVPHLKDVNVLGQLFSSKEFQNEETELVIIVTPYLVEPTDLAKLTDPAQGFVQPTDIQGIFVNKLEAAYGMKSDGVSSNTMMGPVGFILD